MAWREKRLVAGAKSRRCKCPPPNQYADVRDCLVCATPEQRASRLKSNSLRRRRGCKCVGEAHRANKYWCRICTPGVAGVQLRLAKTLANTFRDSLFNRTRYGTPDDHVSMVYPYFWSCGQHDVTMLGPPNYVGHFLSLNPKLTAEGWGKGRDEHGAWTDDHIIPKTAYGATEEDMLRCHNKANHQPLGPSENARKGNRLYRVTLQQYRDLRDHWPLGWCDALPAEVAKKLHAPSDLTTPRKKAGPRFTTLITCKQIYTLKWRRSVCEYFCLKPDVI